MTTFAEPCEACGQEEALARDASDRKVCLGCWVSGGSLNPLGKIESWARDAGLDSDDNSVSISSDKGEME